MDDDKIVPLRRGSLRVVANDAPREPVPEIVASLRELLATAEAGDLRAIAFVAMYPLTTWTEYSMDAATDPAALTGHMRGLEAQLLHEWVFENDGEPAE